MILVSELFLIGISGILVLYAVLAHLSARMGEGLRVPRYYRIYYIAILFLISGALYGPYIYNGEGSEDIMMILFLTGNVLTVAASHRYWWWLKDELWKKKDKGEE